MSALIVSLSLTWWSAVVAGDLAGVFGNWLTILTLSFGLIVWAIVAGLKFGEGAGRLKGVLKAALDELLGTPAEARSFVAEYERIAAKLDNWDVIGPAWRDWRATLITPTAPHTPVRSTLRPADYMSSNLLRACGINPRLHAVMPNLLVGVGLLLTFFGLSLALASAGSIVNADKTAREAGLQNLLNTASAKFVFSLVGLACSIAYTWWRGVQMQSVDRALDNFLAALEERIPLATSALMQAEANAILQKTLDAQEVFSNQLAVSIGSKLDEALDTRLGEHIGPLREAIETLSGSLGSKSEDTIQTMLAEFIKQLHGGTDEAIQQAAQTLKELAASMGEVRTGLSEAAKRMADAADQMALQMGKQADEAMGRIAGQMEGLVDQLRTLATQSRDAGTEAMTQAAKQIATAGDAFTRSAQNVAASLEKAVADMTGRMGGEAEAATQKMTAELSRAIEALRQLAEKSLTAGDDATVQLVERLGKAAAAFEQSSAEVARALSVGAGDAAGRLTGAMEEMKGQFARLADDLGGALRTTGDTVVENSRSGAMALTAAASAAAEALREGGRDSGMALRDGGREAGDALNAAARGLADPARDMAVRLTALQAEAAALATAVTAMREASIAATAPLERAASDLAQAGGSTRAATAELTEMSRLLVPLTEALAGTAARLEAAEQQVAELTLRLTEAVQRFAGMDTTLSGVFDNLRKGLTGFADQVTRFVQCTNNDMAKAAGSLHAAVTEYTEALENNQVTHVRIVK